MNNIPKLKKKVFKYDSSEADEKFFRHEIYKWLKNDTVYKGEYTEFKDLLWNIIYARSNNGTNSKYLYFNEHNQKLYVDRDFYAWADLVCLEIGESFRREEADNARP